MFTDDFLRSLTRKVGCVVLT